MKKQIKKQVGTIEVQNGVEMILMGHNHNGGEHWITKAYFDKKK